MSLTQTGSNLSGSVTIFTNTFPITGTATTAGMSWSIPSGTCGSLKGTGSATSPSPTQLAGSITLDTRGCASGSFFDGPILWVRGASAVTQKGSGSLQDLVAELKVRAQ
jgi:hypothetical protein